MSLAFLHGTGQPDIPVEQFQYWSSRFSHFLSAPHAFLQLKQHLSSGGGWSHPLNVRVFQSLQTHRERSSSWRWGVSVFVIKPPLQADDVLSCPVSMALHPCGHRYSEAYEGFCCKAAESELPSEGSRALFFSVLLCGAIFPFFFICLSRLPQQNPLTPALNIFSLYFSDWL